MPTGDMRRSGRCGTNCLPGNLRLWWNWTLADSGTSGLCSSFSLHLQCTISVDKQEQKSKNTTKKAIKCETYQ